MCHETWQYLSIFHFQITPSRPLERSRMSKRLKTVSRTYGGSRCHRCVRERYVEYLLLGSCVTWLSFPCLQFVIVFFFVSLYLFMLLIVQYYYFDGLTFTWFTELMLLNTCTEEESQVFIFVALSYTIHLSVASRYSVKRNAQSIAQFSPLGWSMDSSIVDANFHTLRTRKSHLRGLQTRQGSGKVGGTHFRNDRRPIANGLSIGASFDDEWLFCTTSSFF